MGGGRWGRPPTGLPAFLRSPRLRPTPRDPATALEKQLRESSGNTNPPTSPSRFPRQTPAPGRPGRGRASPAGFALLRTHGSNRPSRPPAAGLSPWSGSHGASPSPFSL